MLAPSTGCRATRGYQEDQRKGSGSGGGSPLSGTPPGHPLVLLVRRAGLHLHPFLQWTQVGEKGEDTPPRNKGETSSGHTKLPSLGFSTQTCFPKVCWRLQQQQANIYQVIHFENFSSIVCCGYILQEWGQDQKGTVTFSRQGDSAEQLQRLGVGRTDSFL